MLCPRSGQYEPVVSVASTGCRTVVQLQDPSGVVYQTSLDNLDFVTTRWEVAMPYEIEAWFPKMDRAQRFAERIQEPGWSAYDVVQRGRTVTWKSDTDDDHYFTDMLETVGYYGSAQDRKAKMRRSNAARPTWIPAPISY